MSLGLIGHPAAASYSVDSESLPSGSLSPPLMVISGLRSLEFSKAVSIAQLGGKVQPLARSTAAGYIPRHADCRRSATGPPPHALRGAAGPRRRRARAQGGRGQAGGRSQAAPRRPPPARRDRRPEVALPQAPAQGPLPRIDRKSTRLNSSHCNLVCRLLLEKKKQN